MKIKILFSALVVFMFNIVIAQEKVGIQTDEPTRDLDVDGSTRIRDLKEHKGNRVLVADYDGSIGEVKYDLKTADMVVAENAVVKTISSKGKSEEFDLGMEIVATIPPHKKANVFIFYSVPAGIDADANLDLSVNRFYGVKLYKNQDGKGDVEVEAGDSLFRVTKAENNDNVVSIGKNYMEEIVNNTSEEMKITFSLKGIVWQSKAKKTTYRFNKFRNTKKMEAKGKSILISQVYLNKLDKEKK